MATYKVIQDIEAEDKLLGPLTLRQFIYAAVAVLCFYLSFLVISKGAGFFAAVFLPVGFISGFFAWPWSRDQPTEIWALAKIRFMLKPRKRIWDQSGAKELVSVTAPKKIEMVYTNGLSQDEVESRLKALADMIDSRGWATKNVNINLFNAQTETTQPSDRLIQASTLPTVVEANVDIRPDDDILEETNPVARQFDSMIAASTKQHREEILEHLSAPAQPKPMPGVGQNQPNNYWFLNQPGTTTQVPQDAVTFNTQVVTPGVVAGTRQQAATAVPQSSEVEQVTPADEQALIEKLHQQDVLEHSVNPYGHYHIVQPLSAQAQTQTAQGQPVTGQTSAATPTPAIQNSQAFGQPAYPPSAGVPQQPYYQGQPGQQQPVQTGTYTQIPEPSQTGAQQVTPVPNPAILQLASNDDLDVATIAREANKRKELQDEVVISLH
ncbi:MAG TPA: PrgI family protein [Candidatus Saccharimonadales bacterium]|nr:PrgI family protein [Candidatus Saccharimonadales bacterium]